MRLITIMLCCFALLGTSGVYAAQPTTINYSGKGTTFTGKKYRVYMVRCSDGKKRKITSWNKTNWCVGKASTKKCGTSQLKAAATACK